MPWISVEPTNRHDHYHTLEGGAMVQIKPEHRRYVTEAEAVRQGKRLCGQCEAMDSR